MPSTISVDHFRDAVRDAILALREYDLLLTDLEMAAPSTDATLKVAMATGFGLRAIGALEGVGS